MKRKIVLLTAILALIAVFAVVFTACDGTQLSDMEVLQQRYEDIVSAKTIKQEITITSGSLTQFESVKTYTKTESGYTVEGEEKHLNPSSAATPFTVTPISDTVQSATQATPTVKLDEAYFEKDFRLTESGLTAKVKSDKIKDALGVSEDLDAPTDDLTLALTVSGEHVVTAKITYRSSGSNVTITLTMTY